jgi:hypothetical protein
LGSSKLRILEGAKEQWALEFKQTNVTLPTPADLTPYLRNGEFSGSVAEETYVLNAVGEHVEAKLSHNMGQWKAGAVLTVTSF